MTDKIDQDKLINDACCGNESAKEFLCMMGEITQVWDDLVDKDKPVSDSDIKSVFLTLLIRMPRNSFYAQNFAEIQPVIESSIMSWFAANTIEQLKVSRMYDQSHVMRGAFNNLIPRVAHILGGIAWAEQVAYMTALFTGQDESLEDYVAELIKSRSE